MLSRIASLIEHEADDRKRKETATADEAPGDDFYVIESVTEVKEENGKKLFKIKWAGFSSAENTWESEGSVPGFIQNFYEDEANLGKPLPKPQIMHTKKIGNTEFHCLKWGQQHYIWLFCSGAGIVEASKFVKVHKAIHGNQKWYLSLAHTRISDRAGGLAWKEGWGLPEIHPLLKNTVKPFTDKNSRTRHTGRDYTGPCGCKQILFELLPQELKAKVLGLVNMAEEVTCRIPPQRRIVCTNLGERKDCGKGKGFVKGIGTQSNCRIPSFPEDKLSKTQGAEPTSE